MLKFPSLFRTTKEFIFVSFLLIIIISSRLFILYQDYKKFKTLDSYNTTAKVIHIYKGRYNTNLLKLKDKNNLIFYINNSKNSIKKLNWINVKIEPKDTISFLDYLRGFFTDGEILNKISSTFDKKDIIRDKIDAQHTQESMKSFYNAIYLAEPLDKNLRDKIANLGISHLVALSGFHLGIMWLVVFSILYLPYRFLQQKYFPWRNRNIDLGFISLVILAIYVLYVGAPPSLIRSYLMLALGWVFLVIGVELLSFKFLAITLLLILAVKPKLIVSIALFLSFSGVFYIFLILKWLKNMPNWFISFIAIPIGIFFLMFPVGHYFFSNTSIWQLMSAPLSLLFVPFYPLSAILHFVGYGNIFDTYLLKLFELPKTSTEIIIPSLTILIYTILSIVSIFNKKIFITTFILAVTITIYSIYISTIN